MIAPDDVLVALTPRQIAEKIAADARMRLICLKPEYDTIDMGEALIQHAITGLQDRVEELTAVLASAFGEHESHNGIVRGEPHWSAVADKLLNGVQRPPDKPPISRDPPGPPPVRVA